ncbi:MULTISPECIES: bifunctional acetate--CoA ligase family protein/GNAT family N-acetyltransferase [Bradyrhizobium]|jgi:acetyltransferase|uniref:bifunctional acetate--CoA ligase family protein/GNAT family N-acetyltransferase n=1 Tax=Bradyrhizobium TaxID=374 RepID=UPI000484F5CE|nr:MULTISPECIES: bifunctional acetate--CoA ligase family protein/GNAT family N-acetyltransferase [Bradyrhizobium]MCS3444809.1 acetyltransferase [Bradyrhizobium elkanii]MCS3564063.1 acetyltransferase [Bradyrhizobium elkanii]MCW2146105.1 acetyltransferase [Bradyrhizobium elkanii]MCW2354822.1 acetyltransferase [Bradyrhizobium elkanii]MCW2378932.1 acetyltransferase [Bradyrhizobium elkanii]
MSTYGLERLFSPRSIAIVGGSPRQSSLGAAVLRNIKASGFTGRVGVVNRNYADVDGAPTVPELKSLPFVPDLVVISAPAAAVPEIVAEAASAGVAGAAILSAGLGHGAGSLAETVGQTARRHGMRLIGPNCLGVMVPRVKLNASFASHQPSDGHVALISQSGAVASAMIEWAPERRLGFSGIASIGDQLDVDVADLLDYFALDDHTSAILIYLEAVKDARKFMSAARAAARLKPVVIVKSGRMAQGAKAAATHTGALAGSDAVYDAAFRRAGMLRVYDLRQLFDCAELLGRGFIPRGNRLAILTNGGGLGILATDRLAELGGVPATLTAETIERLDKVLPPGWSYANPVDIAGDADADRYVVALNALLDDANSDAVLVANVETAVAPAQGIAEAVAQCVRDRRTKRSAVAALVLAAWVGADERTGAIFEAARIPHFPTEDDAVRAFMYLVRYREASTALAATPPGVASVFTPETAAARHVVVNALSEGRAWLDPAEIVALFAAYHIPIVTTLVVETAEDAAAKAAPFLAEGHAIVVRVFSRDIRHASDVGGVILDLRTKDSVVEAARTVMARARSARPDAILQGVTIQPMIVRRAARELILGIAEDPTFGPVIVFGRGGPAVEVINDKALALPPLDMNLARELIGRTRVSRLLGGYGDVPAVPADVVPLTLVKLAQMAADIPEVAELDINPMLADENGVLALDARVAIRKPTRLFAGHTRLAVRPYPSQWEGELALRDGSRVTVRPMRPEDEPMVSDFFKRVTAEDLRLRFFHAMKEFSHAFIARLTQLDYARAMAFVALDPNTGEMMGAVRLHSDSLYENAEYAILLQSDLKGKGLGWALMQLLIHYARSEGLKRLSGQVLTENTTMIGMCRDLGFTVTMDPEDHSIVDVVLDLDRSTVDAVGADILIRPAAAGR